MIFLTSYIWDLNIFHPLGDDVREPTLHLCGEYLALERCLVLLCKQKKASACASIARQNLRKEIFFIAGMHRCIIKSYRDERAVGSAYAGVRAASGGSQGQKLITSCARSKLRRGRENFWKKFIVTARTEPP